MEKTIKHEKYGEISFWESAWTGRKKIKINGVECQKIAKNHYEYRTAEGAIPIWLKGNFLTGVVLTIANEEIRVTEKCTWYEYVLAFFPVIFILVWGNVPASINFFPIVGGALGGAISAGLAIASMLFMKSTQKILYKILVGLAFAVLSICICHVIANAILSAAAAIV